MREQLAPDLNAVCVCKHICVSQGRQAAIQDS